MLTSSSRVSGRRAIAILFCAVLIATGVTIAGANSHKALAASCYANTCEGLDPYSTGCASYVVTEAWVYLPATYYDPWAVSYTHLTLPTILRV